MERFVLSHRVRARWDSWRAAVGQSPLLRRRGFIRLDEREELYKMPGEPPNLTYPPPGCRFHPRCPFVMPICKQEKPTLLEISEGHMVHCWRYQDAPKGKEALKEVAK